MAYSRYGSIGAGLSDRAQKRYDRSRIASLLYSAPTGRGIFDQLADIRLGQEIHEIQTKGIYSSPKDLAGLQAKVAFQDYERHAQSQKAGSQFGANLTGGGQPIHNLPWQIRRMLSQETSLGKPPGEQGIGGIGTLIGLAAGGYLVFKLLV